MLRRLAVTAQRREVAAPYLRGRHADERGHRGNVGQRAPILNRRMSSQYVFTMYKLSRTHPAGQAGAEGHLAVLHARREDRRARPQRLRQVDAAADHGRARHRVPRRGAARSRRHRRAARAGAPARREQGRARQRRGRRRRDARAARSLQRARRQLLRRDRRRVRAHPGAHRRRRRLESRHAARHSHGRAASTPCRRRRNQALRRRAPPRRALPAAAERARPAAARRADEPPRRRVRRLARAPPRGVQGHRRGRHPRSLLPRQRRGLDPRARPRPRHPVPGQLLELARAEAGAARAGGEAGLRRASARSPPSSSGCARTPRAGARSPRRG